MSRAFADIVRSLNIDKSHPRGRASDARIIATLAGRVRQHRLSTRTRFWLFLHALRMIWRRIARFFHV